MPRCGTRPGIVGQINAEALPDVRERMITMGFEAAGTTVQEFDSFTRTDAARWARVIGERTSDCGEVFVYFKHEEEGKGPEFARMLMDHLRVT